MPSTCASAHPLQSAGPLREALGLAERPDPQRDEDDGHDEQGPDEVEQLRDRRARDEPGPDALEDVRRR